MGVPYSREIDAALNQITPLVAEASDMLQTTRTVSLLFAAVQILTLLFRALTLIVLLGILLSINPDTSAQRQALVTPVMEWMTSWLTPTEEESQPHDGVDKAEHVESAEGLDDAAVRTGDAVE
ncbi:hypothetical protein Tdes44962_MAKER08798 [Teratosphaeria destructans]|uniref:Uncharacterized protein n=1 Tax=Teratosphaeria destructans TaxID=418781 RepID=A0A9W7W406_9PEZI|nr:hypothetical protein Tdes44962_MAKER08798 [Teratosphaeria destructans]